MNQQIPLTRSNSAVKALLAATFPNYRGRKVVAEVAESVTLYDTNWSGGTRNTYHFVQPNKAGRLIVPAPWVNSAEGETVELSASLVVVKHTQFCGTDYGVTVYLHPSLAPKLVAAPAA